VLDGAHVAGRCSIRWTWAERSNVARYVPNRRPSSNATTHRTRDAIPSHEAHRPRGPQSHARCAIGHEIGAAGFELPWVGKSASRAVAAKRRRPARVACDRCRRPDVERAVTRRSFVTRANRGGRIRTDDFLLPKQALYQAELRPAWRKSIDRRPRHARRRRRSRRRLSLADRSQRGCAVAAIGVKLCQRLRSHVWGGSTADIRVRASLGRRP
jgi:hypothetical protein